jgi:hypothetical protein
MPTDDSAQVPVDPSAHESRRWRIGIAISLFFGIFSAVMAFLSYADRTRPAAPTTTPATPAATVAPAEPAHGHKGHGR